jgi:hypothetical protein
LKASRLLLAGLTLLGLAGSARAGAAPGSPAGGPGAGAAAAPAPAAQSFVITRAAKPVKIDGVLDDPVWTQAPVYLLPYEWSPGENVPAPVRTEFMIAYDDRNLYLAWRCFDPDPAAIRAHFVERDDIDTLVQDDLVELTLDTFNDHQRGYEFRVNARGVQADALYNETASDEDFTFDMIWAAAGRITDFGWIVEVAIPLNQIQFPRRAGPQTWGIAVGRSYPRNVRHRLGAAPRDRDVVCVLCQINRVTGFDSLPAGHDVELDPTLTAHRTDDDGGTPGAALRQAERKVSPGLSARWGITPSIRLNAAINPDFSQVEADVAQLAVNQRFTLFYPEKRPFFLEASDTFATPLQVVFTRTVAAPQWGVKLTGKEGGGSFGLFVADDTRRGDAITIPSNQESQTAFLDQAVKNEVFRYQLGLARDSRVGVLFTGRQAGSYHNEVYGADAFLRFSPSDTLALQALRSDTRYPAALAARYLQSASPFAGSGLLADFAHNSRDWAVRGTYTALGSGFRADSGYLPRVDVRDLLLSLQRQFYGGPGAPYTQVNVGATAERVTDRTGLVTDEKLALYGNAAGSLQSVVSAEVDRARTFFGGVVYDGLTTGTVTALAQPSGVMKLSLAGTYGDTVDFVNNRRARIFELVPAAVLKVGRHFSVQLSDDLRRLDVRGGRLVSANLAQARLVYEFDTRTLVRGIFQYLDQRQNPALFVLPVPALERHLFTQLLFSYKINPQTVLFAGYSDDRGANQAISLAPIDRTFFLKLGYAVIF